MASQDENNQTGSDDGQNSFGVVVSHWFSPLKSGQASHREAAEDYQHSLSLSRAGARFEFHVSADEVSAGHMPYYGAAPAIPAMNTRSRIASLKAQDCA